MSRSAQVEAEIAALPGPPGSTACGSYLRRLLENGVTLHPETLVFIIREARLAGCSEQDELACVLLTGLQVDGTVRGGSCESIIRRAARKGGFAGDPERLHDFRQRVYGDMFRQIRADRSKQLIWEQAFYFVFRRRVLDLAETFMAQARRDQECDPLDMTERSAIVDTSPPIDEELFRRMSTEQLDSLVLALEGNPGRAFFLRYVENLAIKGIGGVADLLGVSDRTVRTYLTEAKQTLSRDPRVIAIKEDLCGN
jgi:DNA-directed RNA polymerase specialized sigma24 family protein